VSESRLARSLGAEKIRLASEFEMKDLCPDCEVGAAPPFGRLYGLSTYVSPVLARDERITFNAGTHRDAVRMAWSDYERLAQPRVVSLSRHEEESED
jgi:Ala-tRNA(Pro) deacylase